MTSASGDIGPEPGVGDAQLALALANGAVVSLPTSAWLNQDLVRGLFLEAAGIRIPPFDGERWLDFVMMIYDNAEDSDSRG
jgi:hypothetical protein